MSETSKNPTPTIFSEIGEIFSSVRTTISLLFLLAAASVIGTIIPQTPFPEMSSQFFQRLTLILDLNNVYRSWWFVLILTFLALNLLGCLIKRLPKIYKEWNELDTKAPIKFSKFSNKSKDSLITELSAYGSNLLGSKPEVTASTGSTSLKWIKHKSYLLGFPFLHIAIIVILLGGTIGLIYGSRGHVLIREGESAAKYSLPTGQSVPLPFEILVSGFTLVKYPTGEPKEFRSDVRLLEKGKEALTGSIRVNHPLTYKGISLYQSDYKVVGVSQVKFEALKPDNSTSEIILTPRQKATIPGTDIQLQLRSLDPGATTKGAGAQISAIKGDDQPIIVDVYKNTEPAAIGDIQLKYVDYSPLYATGLQISYDPGSPFVWIGSIALILGFLLILFTNYRRLTMELAPKNGKVEVKVLAQSRRLRGEFRQTLEESIGKIVK